MREYEIEATLVALERAKEHSVLASMDPMLVRKIEKLIEDVKIIKEYEL